jgi:hypothetical protein
VLDDVACASRRLCVAVDAYGDVVRSTDPSGGARQWSKVRVDRHRLDAISCPSTRLCVAVDSRGSAVASTRPTAGASAWTSQAIDRGNGLFDVSCPSARYCVTLDDNITSLYMWASTRPTRRHSWRSRDLGDYPHVQPPAAFLSCLPSHQCVIVDTNGDVFGGANQNPRTLDSNPLDAVSCADAGLCVAVDDQGKALVGTF